MLVTIAMPALNEEHYIEACIKSVQAQDYPARSIEILVADGRSTDATREILARLAADRSAHQSHRQSRSPAGRRARPDRQASAGRRHRAHGRALRVRARLRAASASRRSSTPARTTSAARSARAKPPFQRALCAALTSPLGVGGARIDPRPPTAYVDTVFLGAFRRRVFETVGLWDPRGSPTRTPSSTSASSRAAARSTCRATSSCTTTRATRSSSLAKQYFKYGRGRARTLLKLGRFSNVRPAIRSRWSPAPPRCSRCRRCGRPCPRRSRPTRSRPVPRRCASAQRRHRGIRTTWAIFPVLHVSHGVGFAIGLWQYLRSPDWPDVPERVGPKKVQLRAV